MNLEILTREDLQAFRIQLLRDLRELLSTRAPTSEKIWLKSSEAKKVLKVSSNTLQKLRVRGKLHPAKVGGLLYYSQEEIYELLGQSEQTRKT